MIKDIEKLISFFTKQEMLILDPFMGSGTTAIAAYNLNRKSIGIDLNKNYLELAKSRFDKKNMVEGLHYQYIVGNSIYELNKIDTVDYIVTSPPYHNILKNKNSGIRSDNSHKGFRNGARSGVEFYSNDVNDLGNQETYLQFKKLFSKVMIKCYQKLKPNKYCSIIISDFTVDKCETNVQGDIVKLMEKIGFEFVGTTILLQDNKPLYPFGYPFAYKINHMHQNIINFRKPLSDE